MTLEKLRVAVLRGGPSSEYEVSLRTGETFLSLLRQKEHQYEPIDVLIDRAGIWHIKGLPVEPHKALKHVDVVLNGMHGAYGEDGKVQQILTAQRVPYVGSEAVPSALAMHKHMAKEVYKKAGLKTPEYRLISAEDNYEPVLVEVFRTFLHPVIVKPATSGSSLGLKIAHTWEELKEAVKCALEHSKEVLVEEYIRGKEATCGVIDNFRGERFYAPIPVEIMKPRTQHLFDYESKYSGKVKEQCPGSFSHEQGKSIEEAARKAHEALGLRHYSRSDFILTPRGTVYILETNTLPGFTKESLLPKSLEATGIKLGDFLDHLIAEARK